MVCVNCVFISHSSTRGHVQSRAPGIEDKGHHFFCAVVGARPDLRTARGSTTEPAAILTKRPVVASLALTDGAVVALRALGVAGFFVATLGV